MNSPLGVHISVLLEFFCLAGVGVESHEPQLDPMWFSIKSLIPPPFLMN